MIKVDGLSKSYGKRIILNDISFEADCGEQIAIIGRNGCGKSTLMQILTGIIKPDKGSIVYFQKDVLADKKLFSKFCGYLPQSNPLISELSVQDNLSLWTGKIGKPDADLIQTFELNSILKMPVYKLSGGMKRRVSIACSMALWPPVLFMDEPTTALDIYYKDSIHVLMKKYLSMNGTLIITTHDKEEMESSSRLYEMTDGVLHPYNCR